MLLELLNTHIHSYIKILLTLYKVFDGGDVSGDGAVCEPAQQPAGGGLRGHHEGIQDQLPSAALQLVDILCDNFSRK